MTEYEFIQDGISYVPSKVAAKSADLSADYISRMCREGLVQATWHRGTWHVNENSLAAVLAERRAKQEEHARAQSEMLKRALPILALSLVTILILATSVFALPQSAREKIAAQLPFDAATALEDFSAQHLSNARTQLAAAATSVPNYITQKVQSFFCWWLECEGPIVEVAEQRPRPSTKTTTQPKTTIATTTRTITAAPPQLPPQTIVNQPIVERVRETVRTVISGGIDAAILDARLSALNTDLSNRMNQFALANTHQTNTVYNTVAQALNIEELTDLILHSPIIDGALITGGSISGASISGTISAIINTASAIITSLTATELVATNATTTNATTTNLYVSGTAALPTTSVTGDLAVSGTLTAGALSVAALSSGGAVEAPYFTATSTSATSTFAGGLAVETSGFVYDSSTNRVGIGTTSPYAKLSVVGPVVAEYFHATSSTATSTFAGGLKITSNNTRGLWVEPSGSNGNTPVARFQYSSSGGIEIVGATASTAYIRLGDTTSSSLGAITYRNSSSATRANSLTFSVNSAERMTIDSSGNVGIASTSPWRTLSVTGTIGFDGLTGATGAGSLCLDSNKQVVYNSASDACLSSTRATKHDITSLDLDALGTIDALEPVSFVYNQGDGRVRFGFIAEDTAAVNPHLATYDASSTISGIDDRAILSIVVKALKELASKISETAHLVIDTLTAKLGIFDKVRTNELCVGSTCVTETQFMAVFSPAAAGSLPTSVISPPSTIRDPDPSVSVTSPSETRDVPATQDTPLSSSTSPANGNQTIPDATASSTVEASPPSVEPEALPPELDPEVNFEPDLPSANDYPPPPDAATGS